MASQDFDKEKFTRICAREAAASAVPRWRLESSTAKIGEVRRRAGNRRDRGARRA
jgi:hypothetical protein